jgi:exodeoxyribonuclease VII small subunit
VIFLNFETIMKDFDYNKALEKLEAIAKAVEDPSTGLDDIDKYVKQSEELIEKCRAYLRSVREKTEESFD